MIELTAGPGEALLRVRDFDEVVKVNTGEFDCVWVNPSLRVCSVVLGERVITVDKAFQVYELDQGVLVYTDGDVFRG